MKEPKTEEKTNCVETLEVSRRCGSSMLRNRFVYLWCFYFYFFPNSICCRNLPNAVVQHWFRSTSLYFDEYDSGATLWKIKSRKSIEITHIKSFNWRKERAQPTGRQRTFFSFNDRIASTRSVLGEWIFRNDFHDLFICERLTMGWQLNKTDCAS